MSQLPFTHLHFHTEYSLLDGANKISELGKKLASLGMTSCAITDHGNMFGAVEFYKSLKKEGIKPIIGIEAYLHNNETLGDKSNKQRFHCCLFAKNEVGYKNLMYIASQSYIEGFYYYPRINKKLLKEHSEGLICTSACLQGEVNWHLNTATEKKRNMGAGGYEKAKEVALEYREIFGDDFYLEIMRHGIGDQFFIDQQVIALSKETGIKIIATNDTHYQKPEDANPHEAFMCISMQTTLDDPKRLRHSVHEFFIKSPEQMAMLFADIPEALLNTQEIVDKCELEIKLGNPIPPNYKFTTDVARTEGLDTTDDGELFEYLSRKGLKGRLEKLKVDDEQVYIDRLEFEIGIIKQMGFPGYMLIVWDYINFARESGIPVGPGRGSAAGSLVAYALGITDIDPIPYNLLFERFLNPERVSMPDIDTDFCQDRRGEVIEYASQKYGKFNVAQVITFGSLLAKGVLRDVARVLGVPYAKADAMAKLIPEKLGIKLAEAFEQEEKIRELVASDPLSAKVWEYGLALEGLKRNAGTHAAGIVISNEELWHKAPLYRPSGEDAIVCGYDGRFLEDVDLIKFDFLGLKTLTVVDNAVKLIEKIHGVKIDMVTLDVNDPKVYETIRSGQTKGLFQIESSGMQNLAMRLKPSNFEDIIAMVALYRPGPMDAGMLDDFVDRKHGKKEVSFMFAELEPILSPTYGVIVYQEQVMQIVQTIGGFSLGEADVIRRAMGKKQIEYMQQKKSQFADGAAAQGMDGAKAAELFDLIEKFAGYGFNKSHSAAYALITFYTAWLKTYYTTEFMAALLTSEQDKTEKVVKYIDELKHLDIVLAPPSVQKSQLVFSTSKEGEVNTIHFGLGAIKGVGEGAAQGIIDARNEGGEFSDLADFLSRIDTQKANKKILEALIKSGALDSFGHSRKALLGDIDKIVAFGQDSTRAKKNAENSLFGDASEMVKFEIVINDAPEYALLDILDLEKESLGFYISGHPLDPFREELEKINYTMSTDLDQVADGSDLLLAGVVGELVTKINKKGNKYMIAPLMDFHGTTELMLFERDSKKIEAMDLTRPLVVRANVSKNENFIRLNIKKILTLEEAMKEKVETKIEEKPSEPLIVSLNVTTAIDDIEKLYMLVRAHPGSRDLHVWIKAKLQEVRIETKLRVSDEIVEKLVDLGFIDVAA